MTSESKRLKLLVAADLLAKVLDKIAISISGTGELQTHFSIIHVERILREVKSMLGCTYEKHIDARLNLAQAMLTTIYGFAIYMEDVNIRLSDIASDPLSNFDFLNH